ncbi:MAG: hypothetical protein HFE47_06695 [Clostridia bacterium]|jgi:hypothetical protein|nr:hypothetical protein [Clostridia bacterium]
MEFLENFLQKFFTTPIRKSRSINQEKENNAFAERYRHKNDCKILRFGVE